MATASAAAAATSRRHPHLQLTPLPDGCELVEALASNADAIAAVKQLFVQYADGMLDIGVDLRTMQSFDDEIDGLPSYYDPAHRGRLFVVFSTAPQAQGSTVGEPVVAGGPDCAVSAPDASAAGSVPSLPTSSAAASTSPRIAAGCIAIRRLSDDTAEVKRLYVSPLVRGKRLGEYLAGVVTQAAFDMGYTHVVLDTLARLPAAIRVYTRVGYTPIPRYNDNPMPDIQYYGMTMPE